MQSMLPDVVIDGEWVELDLDSLPPNEELVGDDPPSELLKSITAYGVLQPIVVERDDAGGPYTVMGGRRRIKAARKIGLDRIPARVYPQGWANVHAATITLNSSSRQNVVADLTAIKGLLGQGHTEQEIAKTLGISLKVLQSRTKLLGLVPELVEALLDGRIKPSVAESAVSLCQSDQKRLAGMLDEGVVGAKQVAEVKQVAREQASTSLKPLAGLGNLPVPKDVATAPSGDSSKPTEATPPATTPKTDRAFKALQKAVEALRDATSPKDDPSKVVPAADLYPLSEKVCKAFDSYSKSR